MANLDIIARLTNEASGPADDIASSLGGIEREAGEAGGGIGSLGGTITTVLGGAALGAVLALSAAVIGIGTASFAAGAVVDGAMDGIVIASGATGDELATLRDDFSQVFSTVPTDAGTASEVIGTLNSRLGISGEQLQGLAAPLLEASRLMGGDAATNTELFTRVLGDWGVSVEDGAGLLDSFFATSQETGAGMETLMGQVVQFGSPLRNMGFSLEDSIAMFAKWEQEGVNSELVMGGLRTATGQLADAGLPLNESLAATFDSIANNEDATAALAEGMDIFGTRAGPDMVAAIREGRFAFDDLLAVMDTSEGAIMDTAAQTNDFGETFTTLKNRATLALEPMGAMMIGLANDNMPLLERGMALVSDFVTNSLVPALITFSDWISTVVIPLIQEWGPIIMSQLIPGLQQLFIWGNDIAAVVFPLLAGALQFVIDNFNIFGPILGVIGVAILAINAPLVLITGAVLLLATAWANNWGDIQGKTEAVVGFIQPLIEGALAAIQAFWDAHGAAIIATVSNLWALVQANFEFAVAFIQSLIQTALSTVQAFWQAHGDSIMTIVNFFMTTIQTTINTIITVIQSIVTTVLATVQALWDAHGAAILAAAELAWTTVQTAIDNILVIIGGIIDAFAAAIEGDWTAFGESLRVIWEAAWESIKLILSNAWTAISGIVDSLVQSVISYFTNTDWAAVGSDIIEGIANGITSAASWLADAASAAAQAAYDAALGFFDIGSPSRLMEEEVGKPISEGMALGIRQNIGMVEEAMRSLLGKTDIRVIKQGDSDIGIGAALAAMARQTAERGLAERLLPASGGATYIDIDIDARGAAAGVERGLEMVVDRAVARALERAGQRAERNIRTRRG